MMLQSTNMVLGKTCFFLCKSVEIRLLNVFTLSRAIFLSVSNSFRFSEELKRVID
ncbi:hypothetical protein BDF20DRAFT_841627, partial [Mycotypha africana]|uniref:uncharacterized protein n=1 Tax=Mycotypha africana TaxID=64632 RepID=UPI002300C1C2